MGLVGSRHFVEHPTVALEDVRAMINFDMIGRLSQGKYVVFGTGTAAEFPDLVARAADEAGVTYRAANGLAGNSDHAPFIEQRIPALFAFTGVHQHTTRRRTMAADRRRRGRAAPGQVAAHHCGTRANAVWAGVY
jgi:Zn-dependent M28 family amino/carboxypeptidase